MSSRRGSSARAELAGAGRLALLLAGLALLGAALLAPGAEAAGTLTAAHPSPYNAAPRCPVSAAHPVCGPWCVPVDPSNPFGAGDYGQCTYWAAEKYPSLVAGEALGDPLGGDWDGWTFSEHAQQEGLALTSLPAAGELAVWGQTADDPWGHVAYVESVAAGGSIVISQMDGQSASLPQMQGTTEFLTPFDLSYFVRKYRLTYIAAAHARPRRSPLLRRG